MGVKLKINKFLGYTTKPDEHVGEPGLAVRAKNCFVHQGDLVNLPAMVAGLFSDIEERAQHYYIPIGVYSTEQADYIVIRVWSDIYVESNKVIFLYPTRLTPPIVIPSEGIEIEIDHDLNDINDLRSFRNLIQQVGDWGYVTGEPGEKDYFIDADWELHGLPSRYLPRQMVQFTLFRDEVTGVDGIPKSTPVGVHAPYYLSNSVRAGNSNVFSGSYELALSIINSVKDMPLDIYDGGGASPPVNYGSSSYKPDYNAESNILAVAEGVQVMGSSTRRYFTFELTLHPGVQNLILNKWGGITVGLYARKENESHFDFLGYWSTGANGSSGPNSTTTTFEQIDENNNDTFVSKYGLDADNERLYRWVFTIDVNGMSFDVTKAVPITGATGPILGSHDVPEAAFFIKWFKGRLYYATLDSNKLEYSMRTVLGEKETGTYAQYIEGREFIGNANEPIIGMEIYLGRLFIFKANEVWVLTDDIVSVGRLFILFSDIGCSGDGRSKSILAYNNMLYWVYKHKNYKYDGINKPVVITDIIEKELEEYDTSKIFITVNEKYDLIYFNEVPHGQYMDRKRGLIYNAINGTWTDTNIPINEFIRLPNKYQFGATNNNIYYVQDIDKKSFFTYDDTEFIVWESSEIDLQELGKDKWWKHIQIIHEYMMKLPANPYSEDYIEVYDENGVLLVGKNFKDFVDYVKIGRHTKRIKIKIIKSVSRELYPFRLKELQLEAEIRGRR